MFEISWSEIIVVAVIALVVVGPKDLPPLLRQLGRMIGQVKRMAGDFQTQFNDAVKEAELDDLKQHVDDLRRSANAPFADIKDTLSKDWTTTGSAAVPQDSLTEPVAPAAIPAAKRKAAARKAASSEPAPAKPRRKTASSRTSKAQAGAGEGVSEQPAKIAKPRASRAKKIEAPAGTPDITATDNTP